MTPRVALTLLVGAALQKHGVAPEGAHRAIADEILAAGWRAPSTQDETEWEWGYRHQDEKESWTRVSDTEVGARVLGDQDGWLLFKRRKSGPWVSVSSVEGDR